MSDEAGQESVRMLNVRVILYLMIRKSKTTFVQISVMFLFLKNTGYVNSQVKSHLARDFDRSSWSSTPQDR